MIQKRIFFVWLGTNKPKYVDFCIENFKIVNKDFEIIPYFFSDDDVEASKKHEGPICNYISYDIIDNCLNRSKNNLEYKERYKNEDNVYKIFLSVQIRYSILYKYGGIYLDCDTFPIKPFDDELLKLDNFGVSQEDNKTDIFFLGRNKDTKLKRCVRLKTMSNYKILWNNKDFINMCEKFNLCQLKYGDHYNDPKIHYIDHYWIRENKYGIKR